jgi:hypothetical protein
MEDYKHPHRLGGVLATLLRNEETPRNDLANVKQISSGLPDYILPLAGVVNRDSVPRDFKYTLITAYLPKGIRTVGPQLGLIPALKINDFNLGD